VVKLLRDMIDFEELSLVLLAFTVISATVNLGV
jgi:hypothetical protein